MKTTGLDREQLHEPLLKKLSNLSKHRELHLSQAASYAYQALLGIPDNEGPWASLWRHAYTVTGGAARVAGAVFTVDPSKLLEGLEMLQNVPDLINCMIDLLNATRNTSESLKFPQKQKSWYVALRFTALLIHANAFGYLKNFVLRVPCLKEKDFLCGIFAQLEAAWETGGDSARNFILGVLDGSLVQIASESEYGRVREWVKSIANTLGHMQWQEALQSPQQHLFLALSREKSYTSEYCNLGMRNETLQGALLEKAWQRCPKAHVFYADLMIREYYTEGRRLKIERLSGTALPMSQCYINLAIIQHRAVQTQIFRGAAGKQSSSSFSLFSRLKINEPPEELRTSLPMLFNPRKQRDGIVRPPKRIFIEGQAGIGKSTLCKKMVYNYIHYNMWIDLFDRLIWIPLRKLKSQLKPGYSLKDLLYNEYFLDRMDSHLFADALWRVILKSSTRTLFILDGLDEVAQGFDSHTGQILQNLLNQSHVIITSRPYRSSLGHMKPPDLELETIGFYHDQVDAYIEKATCKEAGREIQSFMQEHMLIQELARVPIQLEAICYCWDGISAEVPTTMTTLYQAIELRLWRKDAWYLTKVPTLDVAQQLTKFEITWLVQAEINLLQSFAFTGLYNDILEFDTKFCDQIFQHKDQIMKHLRPPASTTMSTVLAKLSLLRPSDTSDEGYRSYHFLHLTFQEYFAAQYYVEHWKSGKPLPYLKIRNRKARLESISPESFLQQEKYNARYDVFWRFVTGILQSQDEDHLWRFFSLIEDEPRDLLGPVHQRLVMHCLSEMAYSNQTSMSISLREKLEKQLSRWALFECESRSRPAILAGDPQFPESLLEVILQEGSEDQILRVMQSLPARRTSLPKFIEFITIWLREGVSPDIMAIICKKLNQIRQHLPDETFNALAGRLEDQHYSIRCTALRFLGKQRTLPEGILEDVAKQLQDTDSRVREAALYALSDSLDPREELTKANMVRSQNFTLVEHCVPDPGDQLTLLKEIRETVWSEGFPSKTLLATMIEACPSMRMCPEEFLVREIIEAVAKPRLSENIINAVAQRLDDKEWNVREAAVNALGAHSILPGEILVRVAERLDDRSKEVREAAALTLGGQSILPRKILEAVAKRLDDKNSDVRDLIVFALGSQYNLPKEILKAVAKQLDDTESNVRHAVATTFGFQPNYLRVHMLFLIMRLGLLEFKLNVKFFSKLPDDLVALEIAETNDEDKEAMTRALNYHSTLPVDVLTLLAKRLNDKDSQAREAITLALARQSNLPEEIVTTVAARLKDGDIRARDGATRILKQQSILPEEIGRALVVAMNEQKDREETNDTHQSIEDEISSSPAAEDEISLSSATEDEVAKGLIDLISLEKHESQDRSPALQFQSWLKQSFDAQIVLYIKDNNLCFQDVERLWSTPFKSRKEKRHFMAMIREIRTVLGVPQ